MDKLLNALLAGGTLSTAELSYQTGMSAEMVEARLEHYARLGYLKKTVFSARGGGCGGGCASCKGCGSMQNNSSQCSVFWEAGEKMISKSV